ncbi:hypothetical protein ACTNEW_15615 [Blautia sp. HCP3S3_G3]|uniref:hypothetical protein n=1 Tax=Blautia sp. HCP3S3_G3 TaxID=3438913 RepID=UPI003F8AE67D
MQSTTFTTTALIYPAADLDSSTYDPERQLNTHIIELAKCDWIDEPNNLLSFAQLEAEWRSVPPERMRSSWITLEMPATLNKLTREKDHRIEITVDGELSK